MSDFGSEPAPVLLRADRLLAHADAPVIEDGAVLAVDGRIAAVGPWAEVSRRATADTRQVELGDRTLMPGLIDCHVHLAMDASVTSTVSELTATDAELACRMVNSARRLLDAGVTAARDLGCRGAVATTVRDGLVPGPRLQVANAPITVTAGHAWTMGGEADGALEVVREVRIRAKQRTDVIKIMSTGGVLNAGSRPGHRRH